MPVVLALLAAAGAALFWYYRARNAANVTHELLDVANDVRLAARRFGFRRKSGVHPVEQIEDPKLAIATIACAFLELDALPSTDAQKALQRALQQHLRIDLTQAEEMMVLGRWLGAQCGGASAAITRATRKLYKLDGVASVQPLMAILQDIAGTALSDSQRDALGDITRAMRL